MNVYSATNGAIRVAKPEALAKLKAEAVHEHDRASYASDRWTQDRADRVLTWIEVEERRRKAEPKR